MLSVAVNRTSLSLGVLTFADMPGTGYWVDEVTRPAKTWRRTVVTSPFTHGGVQTQATLDTSPVNLAVYVEAATSAALATLRDEVEAAFFQWSFSMTVTEDGVANTYSCDCADIAWNDYDLGMTQGRLSRGAVTVPVYPIAS